MSSAGPAGVVSSAWAAPLGGLGLRVLPGLAECFLQPVLARPPRHCWGLATWL